MTTIEHASYSSAQDMMGCGLRWWLKKEKGYAEHPAWWSVGGVAVHKATESYDLGADGTPDKWFIEAWDETMVEQMKNTDVEPEYWRSSRGQNEDWWLKQGPVMVQSWIDWREESGWDILEVAGKRGVELPIQPVVGGVKLKGFIDRVFVDTDGAVVIMDLKTGARKPDSALQLGYYRVGMMEEYGVTADWGAWFLPRKKPGDQMVVEHIGKYDVDYIGRLTSGFKQQVESGVFLPNTSSWCQSCGMRKHCWAQASEITDETPIPPPVSV